MKSVFRNIVGTFLAWTLVGVLSKPLFMLVHIPTSLGDVVDVMWHGLRLDFAVAAYFTALPALMTVVSTLWKGMPLHRIMKVYNIVIAVAYSLALVANIALYGYWGFPLDSTPLFYLTTSPADAAASVTLNQGIFCVFALWVCSVLSYWLVTKVQNGVGKMCDWLTERCRFAKEWSAGDGWKLRICRTVVAVLLAAALIVPMRGGFTVAVNNVGSVYFSDCIVLNHAAVNPVFTFLDSFTEDTDFGSQYRFMTDEEAQRLFDECIYTADRQQNDSAVASDTTFVAPVNIKNDGNLRIVMVILESFSKQIMTETGVVSGVTPTLDRLADESVYFTKFYANSFRTDRGLMSILSGVPAQPTMSLMKFPAKTNDLYSIARSLRSEGYATHYVYGGDANFTNMRSYLMATGFNDVVSEEDYPQRDRTSKWGVNDSVLFDRALVELAKDAAATKGAKRGGSFTVVQTSSSHEPFDVPQKVLDNAALNAFNYTDRHLGRFIAQLKAQPEWANTLLIIVPDHLGCYPERIDNFSLSRYEIPMMWTGGVVTQPQRVPVIASQQDIPATLLGTLGIDHSEFTFSKDIFDPRSPHFAFFSVPDAMGMVTADDAVIYDNVAQKAVLSEGKTPSATVRKAQAYLQKLYDFIAEK